MVKPLTSEVNVFSDKLYMWNLKTVKKIETDIEAVDQQTITEENILHFYVSHF